MSVICGAYFQVLCFARESRLDLFHYQTPQICSIHIHHLLSIHSGLRLSAEQLWHLDEVTEQVIEEVWGIYDTDSNGYLDSTEVFLTARPPCFM